jgi:hypothetical protein
LAILLEEATVSMGKYSRDSIEGAFGGGGVDYGGGFLVLEPGSGGELFGKFLL